MCQASNKQERWTDIIDFMYMYSNKFNLTVINIELDQEINVTLKYTVCSKLLKHVYLNNIQYNYLLTATVSILAHVNHIAVSELQLNKTNNFVK